MKNTFTILALLMTVPFLGCKDDPSGPASEQELITDIVIELISEGNGDSTTATFSDPDGDGGVSPVITGLTLKDGLIYHGSIELYDKSGPTPDTITHEIEAEAETHRFDYILSGDAAGRISVTSEDKDANNLDIGLKIRIASSPGVPATGMMKVKLNHFATVAKGATNSDETDIEIDFPVEIE